MNAQIDTYRIAQRFKSVGFSEEQAGLVAEVLREARDADAANVATKEDVRLAADESRAEIRELRADTHAEFKSVRAEIKGVGSELHSKIDNKYAAMLQWAVGLFMAQLVAVAGLIKLLVPTH